MGSNSEREEIARMGMTITEKILARAAGLPTVKAGQIIDVAVDLAMFHDGLGPLFYPLFRELEVPIWDPDKVAVVIDHASPPSSVLQTEWVTDTLKFVEEFKLPNFYNMQGIAHQILPEEGFIKPGNIVVGTDSHTCTYGALGAFSTGIGSTEMAGVLATGKLWFRVPESIKFEVNGKLDAMVMAKDIILKVLGLIGTSGATYKAMEFTGETISDLSVDGRLTICNMVVEAGAKNGIVAPDMITSDYLAQRTTAPEVSIQLAGDKDAAYHRVLTIDASQLEPQVACPHNPGNVAGITEVSGVKVHQVLIGTCTGGRMEDFRAAAQIMQGEKVPRGVRCLILPASMRIYRQLLEENLLPIFIDAGCIICNPNCGPCGGLHQGLIGKGEVCVGTHNRNFKGRMGSSDGQVYLASPATAAAAAIAGELVDPRHFV